MADTTTPDATPKRGPGEKEALLFWAILKSLKSTPEVDWDAAASLAGYSNGPSARARYSK